MASCLIPQSHHKLHQRVRTRADFSAATVSSSVSLVAPQSHWRVKGGPSRLLICRRSGPVAKMLQPPVQIAPPLTELPDL